MPNRLLRDGITTSDRIESLTPEEEVFFYRLLVACDDYGRMDARPAILKAQCFPLRDSATSAKIEVWLTGLTQKGLLQRYQHDGKCLLAVAKWEQRVRSRPKYAGPTDDGSLPIDGQLSDICPSTDGLGKGKGKGKGATPRQGRELRTSLPEGWSPLAKTVEWCREFGLRVPEDVDTYVAAFADIARARGYQYVDWDSAFRNCVRQDWPKLRDNSGRVVALPARGERKLAI